MSSDPSFHRRAEQRFIEHIERLLSEGRLPLDALRRRRTKTIVRRSDRAVELKRLMSEMGRPDRELQARMPVGQSIEVELTRTRLLIFPQTVGRFRAISISPTRSLIAGSAPPPVRKSDLEDFVTESAGKAPTSIALISTSGFTPDACLFAESKGVILVEPNAAGGFTVHAAPGIDKDLFNPEADDEKRQRIRDAIVQNQMELSASGVAADRLVVKTQLPAQLVESELKSFAKEHPGLAAKRLDGTLVLFREGSAAAQLAPAGGLSTMPLIDSIRALFARRGETEKKIAFLSERRAALGQQRDRAYEEIVSLESKDSDLRDQFKNAAAEIAKRRITGHLLQLRKDMERRQQLIGVLNQQINVVSTHLHNLELVQQGQTAKLPDSEEMASDAAAAEEMLATLQESSEMAETVGGVAATGLSAEEQALYEELLRDTGAPAEAVKEPRQSESIAGASQTPAGQRIVPPIMPTPEREQERRQRNKPEAG